MKQPKVETELKELYVLLERDLDECLMGIETFEKKNPYISSYPLEIEFHLLKANCLIKSGNMEIAYQTYQNNVEPIIDDCLLMDKKLSYLLKKFKGIFSYHTRDYNQAITDYKEFLKEDLDTEEKAKVNFNIALCYKRKSDSYHAILYGMKALEDYLQILNLEGAGETYNILGNLFKGIENYNDADHNYKNALKLANEKDLPLLECRVLHNLGEMNKDKGHYDKAIIFYNQSLNLKKTKTQLNLSITYCSLIDCYIKSNQLVVARKSLTIALEQTPKDYYRIQLNVLREKLIYLKNQGSSYELSLMAATDFFETINPNLFTLYVKELGQYYWEQRKYKSASACFKRIL